MSSSAETRRRAVQAARGESPFDLLLTDAQIVDMATGEIREADVGIVGETIASVHPRGSRSDALERRSLAGRLNAMPKSSWLRARRLYSGTRTSWPTYWASKACATPSLPAAICRCR